MPKAWQDFKETYLNANPRLLNHGPVWQKDGGQGRRRHYQGESYTQNTCVVEDQDKKASHGEYEGTMNR